MTTFERLKEIIINLTGAYAQLIKPEATLEEDLCLDSLDMVECVMAGEVEFGVMIDDEVLEKIRTVQDAVNAIDAALAAEGVSA